jgi:hypothetical protein
MVTLTAKESSKISFPGGTRGGIAIQPVLTVTVETGVAVFNLVGTHEHDWTRDTLSFPVGAPCAAAEFVSGIAAASPCSFWTPMNNLTSSGGGTSEIPVNVSGTTSGGDSVSSFGSISVSFPGSVIPPPIGFAVDSASVSYSAQAGQPVIELALAVFGNNIALVRVSYTAYIVSSKGGETGPISGPTTKAQ